MRSRYLFNNHLSNVPATFRHLFQANNNVAAFQKLFMAKRIEQLAAVKNIQKLDDSKRKILLDQISAKLFQVLLVTNHWTKLISHSEQSNHGLKIVSGTCR